MYAPAGWYRSIATERREGSYRRFEMWYTTYRGTRHNRVQIQVLSIRTWKKVPGMYKAPRGSSVPCALARMAVQWGRAADAWQLYTYLGIRVTKLLRSHQETTKTYGTQLAKLRIKSQSWVSSRTQGKFIYKNIEKRQLWVRPIEWLKTQQSCKLQAAWCIRLKCTRSEAYST